jgi:uncharacterized protein YgiM (DUF1202 family)
MRVKWLWGSMLMILFILNTESHAKILTITGIQVNVRSGPGRTYDVVEVVYKNEKFEILEDQDGWYKISVEGTIGWVSGKAITLTADTTIQEMLQQADRYFSRQQFTTPPEANAFDIYREVLRKDPKNAHALKKIEQMAKTYKTWAERAHQRGDERKAKIFYQRYLFIVPEDQEVKQFLTQSKDPILNPDTPLERIHLRVEPATLSKDTVVQMIRKYGFHHPADWSRYGLSPSITGHIRHEYDVQSSNGTTVVIDYATHLMWQQSGTSTPMTWQKAHTYIYTLNSKQYAGYSGWRLPTIEELASLLEPAKQNGRLYIASVFGTTQLWCWSADKVVSSNNMAWYVSFNSGGIQQHDIGNSAFVLAVRSIQ